LGVDEADRLRHERRFAEAISAYRGAAQAEPRGWVKRALIARAIGCFRDQNQPARAGDLFLGLYRADPETPHFDAIPLGWLPPQFAFHGGPQSGPHGGPHGGPQNAASGPGDRDLRSVAPRWLAETAHPAAVLLGASWLISAGEPGTALAPLRTLTQNADPRVALLAEAQLWRTRATRATEAEIEAWEKIPPRLPAALRGGPYLTLGWAWQQSGQPERAALAFLRVPIEHSDQPLLAAAALELAARQLEQLQRPAEAARLRREQSARFGSP
jgi:tetratricopeptide (TPR) repeat protein